jgi:hypothetical protein
MSNTIIIIVYKTIMSILSSNFVLPVFKINVCKKKKDIIWPPIYVRSVKYHFEINFRFMEQTKTPCEILGFYGDEEINYGSQGCDTM